MSERTVDARPLFSAQGSFPQSLFEGTNSQRPRRRIRLSKQLSAFKEIETREVYKMTYAAFLLSVVFSVVAGFSVVFFVSVVVLFSADGFVVFSESPDVSFFWASK